MSGDDKAIIRMEVAGFKQSRTMVYEDGAWHQQPSDDRQAHFAKSADEIIAVYTAKGECQGN